MPKPPTRPLFVSVEIDLRKLRDYCLSENHPRGRHKAKVFRSRFGLGADDAVRLRQMIVSAAAEAEFSASGDDVFGERFTFDFFPNPNDPAAVIRTAWIVRDADRVLRFVTCYVL